VKKIVDAFRALFGRREKPRPPAELPGAADVVTAIFVRDCQHQQVRTRRIVDDLSFGTLGGVSFFIPSRRNK
jgi:hypothetical protein